jgi:hypothetical protein
MKTNWTIFWIVFAVVDLGLGAWLHSVILVLLSITGLAMAQLNLKGIL